MNPRIPALVGCASLILAGHAFAQGDLRLGWNNCQSDGGLANTAFACGSNTGTEVLVGTFVLPSDMPQVSGLESTLFVFGAPGLYLCDGPGCSPALYDLPPWWQFQTGGCRPASMSASFQFSGEPFASSTHCFDFWSDQAVGGSQYTYPYASSSPQYARLRVLSAVAPENATPLSAGREYYAFQIIIRHQKTVGTGSCDGCCTPVTLLYNSALVAQPGDVGDMQLNNSGLQATVTWQSPSACPTPTRNRTWGGIKALYR